MTDIEKVALAAAQSKFRFSIRLIRASLEAGVFINHQANRPYSETRIDAMVREGKEWVTNKLVDFAKKNPIE